MLIHYILTFLAVGTSYLTSAQQVEGGCPAGLQGECNGCICCCYKTAIPKYVPSGCECKVQFDSNFIVMAVFVVLTFIGSLLTSWHFSGYSKLNPYKPSSRSRRSSQTERRSSQREQRPT